METLVNGGWAAEFTDELGAPPVGCGVQSVIWVIYLAAVAFQARSNDPGHLLKIKEHVAIAEAP